jgi:hypothetical protein
MNQFGRCECISCRTTPLGEILETSPSHAPPKVQVYTTFGNRVGISVVHNPQTFSIKETNELICELVRALFQASEREEQHQDAVARRKLCLPQLPDQLG